MATFDIPTDCVRPLSATRTSHLRSSRGYATFGSDSGHHHHYRFAPDITNQLRADFALNDEERKNYASESLKKTHDVAVALMEKRVRATSQADVFHRRFHRRT